LRALTFAQLQKTLSLHRSAPCLTIQCNLLQDAHTNQPLDVAKKEIMAEFNPILELLESAEKVIKSASIEYLNEMEMVRIANEAAAAELARKEQEKLLAKAEKMAEKGNEERAQALEIQAATVVAAPVSAPKIASGQSVRKTYKAECVNLLAIVKAVSEGRAPLQCLMPDEKFLNKQASAFMDDFNIDGCKLVIDQVLSKRVK